MTLMINKHKPTNRVCVNFLSKCWQKEKKIVRRCLFYLPKHNLWHKHNGTGKLTYVCMAELLRTDYIDAPEKIDRARTTEKINVITSLPTRVSSGQLKRRILS